MRRYRDMKYSKMLYRISNKNKTKFSTTMTLNVQLERRNRRLYVKYLLVKSAMGADIPNLKSSPFVTSTTSAMILRQR